MAISIYINILLRFLIKIFSVYAKAINYDSYSSQDDEDPLDKGQETPKAEEINDLLETLGKVKGLLEGDSLEGESKEKELNDIKEEYPTYFDEDSGNATEREALEDIKKYIQEELEANNYSEASSSDTAGESKDSSTRNTPGDYIDDLPATYGDIYDNSE